MQEPMPSPQALAISWSQPIFLESWHGPFSETPSYTLFHPLPPSYPPLTPCCTLWHPLPALSRNHNHPICILLSIVKVSLAFLEYSFFPPPPPPRICICICICMDLSGLSPIQADKRKWTSKPIQLRRIDSSSLTIELAKLRPESVDPVWP